MRYSRKTSCTKQKKWTEKNEPNSTYLFLNRFVQIEQSKCCSSCGVTELFLFFRFAVDVDAFAGDVVDFLTADRFKWMRWECSLKLDFRVNLSSHSSHSKMRSLVCSRKWQRSEFLPNNRLHIGHGILSSLQLFHLCSISWKMHSASVSVLWSRKFR